MTKLIRLENVHLQKNAKTILSIPAFDIHKGEVLGIMGPNGAGKSSLLKILAFLEPPSAGSLYFGENKVSFENVSLELRRKFAIALQQSLLLDTTVFQNVAIGLKLRKKKKKEINDKVRYWLEMFKISHLSKKQALHLSGGEAQRVNLARAMVLEPEVLFLDEPFSALDFPTKIQLLKDLKEIIRQTQTTSVFVSHDLMEIKYMSSRLAILMNGEIKQAGITSEVISSPNRVTAEFIGEWKELLS